LNLQHFFYTFCLSSHLWVVIPGNADCLSPGADGFKHEVYNLIEPVPVKLHKQYSHYKYVEMSHYMPQQFLFYHQIIQNLYYLNLFIVCIYY